MKKKEIALILGSNGAIGNAFEKYFSKEESELHIISLSRKEKKIETFNNNIQRFIFNPLNEEKYKKIYSLIKKENYEIKYFVNTIGFLHNNEYSPEKSLKSINIKQLQEYFLINAAITPLAAKYFIPFYIRNKESFFIVMSAKVGSIEDNSLGGWYGYRASKVALNMFIKNISIENRLKLPNLKVIAYHPGTVDSSLSKPFHKNIKHKILTPNETVDFLMKQIKNKEKIIESGSFLGWDGELIQW